MAGLSARREASAAEGRTCLYIYVCIVFSFGGHLGRKHMFKIAYISYMECRLCTSGAQRIRDLDK